MKGRGQAEFVNLPRFAAGMYQQLSQTQGIIRQHHEIASDLAARLVSGRLLDVGTGPGKLLEEIHQLNPRLALFGLDISEAMVALASENLERLGVDLRCGDIHCAPYPDDFFDLVTCTGSFYLWDEPERGLTEIHRILKPGGTAVLFETYQDCDIAEVRRAIRHNLLGENLLRKLLAPRFLMRQLRMTYTKDEIRTIIQSTPFAQHNKLGEIILAGMPAWVQVELLNMSETN